MRATMRQVFSSSVAEIGYDADRKTLLVQWGRTGKVSAYQGVPADLADEVMNAPSVGQALREQIQGNYAHKYE